MFASISSTALVGVEPRPVRVEVHATRGERRIFSIVGLPDASGCTFAHLDKAVGGTVDLMSTYSAEQRELLEELGRLGRPVAGALPPGAKPPALDTEDADARGQKREELKRSGMTDAEIDYAIESLNDYDDT